MRILVTGATGYIGSVVASMLLDRGDQVTGFARDPGKASALTERGMRFVKGDLADPAPLTELAREHDAILHAGMAAGPQAGAIDTRAVEALLTGAKAGGARVLIYTSGIWALGDTGDRTVDEAATTNPHPLVSHRPALERRVLEASDATLRTHVIRPGVVYGGKAGILGTWWSSAVAEKRVQVVGDGNNRWPMVHREDLARLYLLVLERGTPGAIYHGTDDTTHKVIDLARAAARVTGAEVTLWPLEAATRTLGAFGQALTLDQQIRSTASRELGWQPQHPDFLQEADRVYREFVGDPPRS